MMTRLIGRRTGGATRRWVVLGLAGGMVLALTGAGAAEERDEPGAASHSQAGVRDGDGLRGVGTRLGLTADQRKELQRLRVEMRKEQVQRRAAAQVARIELAQLLAARDLDDKAVATKTRELVDAEAALTRTRLEHRAAVARVLTPEQRERARGMWEQTVVP